MQTLMLLPEKEGYSADTGRAPARAQGDGPAGRYGRGGPRGDARGVRCTWVCDPNEYAYLQAFRRTVGGDRFIVFLVVDGSTPEPYVARFVAGSYGLVGLSGETHTVSAGVHAYRVPDGQRADYDAALAMLLSEYGDDSSTILPLLDELANEELPQ